MSKKRPGFEAAVRLSRESDTKLWELVEAQYALIASDSCRSLEETANNFARYPKLTKNQLMQLVAWKFSVGKPRHALKKHLLSNTEDFVKQCTEKGIALAKTEDASNDDTVRDAIQSVSDLKGVGPATASALLSLARPDSFCYMYDEVIDVFRAKRDYTLATYIDVNIQCKLIAEKLGWTPARVARTLWIAARAAASVKVDDLTLSADEKNKENGTVVEQYSENDEEYQVACRRKRLRRS